MRTHVNHRNNKIKCERFEKKGKGKESKRKMQKRERLALKKQQIEIIFTFFSSYPLLGSSLMIIELLSSHQLQKPLTHHEAATGVPSSSPCNNPKLFMHPYCSVVTPFPSNEDSLQCWIKSKSMSRLICLTPRVNSSDVAE